MMLFRIACPGLKNSLADEAAFHCSRENEDGGTTKNNYSLHAKSDTRITNRLTIIAQGEKALDDEKTE